MEPLRKRNRREEIHLVGIVAITELVFEEIDARAGRHAVAEFDVEFDVLSALEVSEIPMFSMKIKKGGALFDIKRTVFFSVSAIMVIITVMLNLHWSFALVLIFGFYILENLLFALAPNSSLNEP